MAKIPTYIAQGGVSTQPGQAYLPRQPGTGAAEVGQALSRVGQTAEGVAFTGARVLAAREAQEAAAEEQRQRIENDQNKQWVNNAITRYQTRLVERDTDTQQNMPSGGVYEDKTTYVDKVKQFSQEELDVITGEAPNAAAAELFKANAFQISEKAYVGALSVQAKESYRYALETNINGAQEDINLLVKKPELLEETWLRRKETILSASNIGQQNKEAIIEKIGASYANLPIQRDLNEAKIGNYPADQIIKDIDNGYYEKRAKKLGLSLTPADLQQARDKAISLSKVRNTDLDYQLDKVADDLMADVAITGKRPPENVYDQFASKGPQYKAALKDKVELVADMSMYNKQMDLDPVGFEKNTLPKLQPKEGEGSARQTKIYEAAVTALNQKKKLLQENPGDAANLWYKTVSSSSDPGVEKAMLTAISRAGEGPNPTPITFSVNTDPSTGQMDIQSETAIKVAYQRSQGLTDRQIEVLGQTKAKALVAELTKPNPMDPQGNYETVRQQLGQFKQAYGKDYFPKVMNELIKAGLPQEFGVLTWADDTLLSNKMVATLQTNVKVYEDKVNLPREQLNALKSSIADGTASYTRALALGAPNGERTAFINSLNNVIYKMAMQQKSVDPNTDLNKFANDTIKQLITDRFHLTDTLAIPKMAAGGKSYDPKLITERLSTTQRYLKASDISADYGGSLPEFVRRDELLNVVKDSGYWVTNGNTSGAYLVIDVGPYAAVPVLGSDGRRIEKSYKELNDPTWQAPKGSNAGKPKKGVLPTETYVNPS